MSYGITPKPTPDLEKREDTDLLPQLEATKEWDKLTPLQKKMMETHWLNPEMNKTGVSREVGCSPAAVYKFFNSRAYNLIALELGRADIAEMRILAIKALRETLTSKNEKIKQTAAIRLLESEGVLRNEPPPSPERKYELEWGKSENKPPIRSKT